jgi:hypothetical protein
MNSFGLLYSKTKTSTQEKSSLPDTNRFTSPITAFRRKKKTPGSSNDPGKLNHHAILLFASKFQNNL